MDTTLRPLSLGEILDRTFHLYRSNFLMFAGIASFAAGLNLIWKLIQTLVVHALQQHLGLAAMGGVNNGFVFVDGVIAVIAAAVSFAAITCAVSAIHLGRPTSIALAYREVIPQWGRYVWLYVIAVFLAWGPVLLIVVALMTTAFLIPHVATGTLVTGALFALYGLSMLVLVPFGIWMSLRYSLSNAACTFEKIKARAALKRSISLSKGASQKLSIFVLILLVWIISAIIMYAALTPFFLLVYGAFASHRPLTQVPIGMTIYTLFVGFIVSSITLPLYSVGLTLFYYDARIRKEGFDVEWLIDKAASETLLPPPILLPAEPAGHA
jgi:hypothetical protein